MKDERKRCFLTRVGKSVPCSALFEPRNTSYLCSLLLNLLSESLAHDLAQLRDWKPLLRNLVIDSIAGGS